jgi:2-hydroxy-4-carboxymuconate semialdehyde hemiacetal dehydrogenase
MTVRVAIAGAGAFGRQHLDALCKIDDVEITSIISVPHDAARAVADRYGVAHATTDLAETVARDDVDAVILCTPTPLHATQAITAMRAGKHVQVEIPLADDWPAAQEVADVALATGVVCMVGHTRRFNPSHQWIHRRIAAGELRLHQLTVQTYFLRRTNTNAMGEPRTWTDHLLWHHAAHTVDLLRYQTGAEIVVANAIGGPIHPELGIAMDMSVQLKTSDDVVCTLSLSFNNDGPFGTDFRYICDNGTYLARYDELRTAAGDAIVVTDPAQPWTGVERQDREFVSAIRENREPLSSVASVLPSYRVLHELDQRLC